MTIRLVLVDDHALFLDGLRVMLEREDDLEVVAAVQSGADAIEAVSTLAPDVVVMDLSMPGMNGIEAMRRILAGHPSVKVLVVSMHGEETFLAAALEAGAAGYLLKDSVSEELLRAIREVKAGHAYLSPAVTGRAVHALRARHRREEASTDSTLTSRERQVLQLIAEGRSTKDTAWRLGLSAKTVSTHRERIMEKLGIHSVAGLTKYAIRHFITTSMRDPE